MVKNLVRFALACEYNRKPIRRGDIGEKVLGSGNGAKTFKTVFNTAQHQLRMVFGMEMVELPGKEKITLQQKRAAQKSQSQASKAPTSWVLVSILPARFRRDPDILPPVAAPTSAEEGKYTSVYTMLVSLILLSGGQLPDAKMDRYLRRLGLEDATPVDGYEKTEKLMKRMEKDGYVLKVRENAGNGEEDVSWIVGPRAKVEVGEKGVEGLVKAVYNHEDGNDEQKELERRIARSRGLGEGAARKAPQANGEKKKRGRPRRDEHDDDEEDGEESEDD
ncbi:uncharacterized protein LTR77_002614 [Saxophila tyrrhenica]|uniref:MAGE domain-containing protein n=1 Tax=Saxophila tyrrhenica TaxID=1690608 RepID=A0AAV9PNW9_9PEZI|nr:hypothetical protein LTR77_002614 [Saxophila tyrrhenica]